MNPDFAATARIRHTSFALDEPAPTRSVQLCVCQSCSTAQCVHPATQEDLLCDGCRNVDSRNQEGLSWVEERMTDSLKSLASQGLLSADQVRLANWLFTGTPA